MWNFLKLCIFNGLAMQQVIFQYFAKKQFMRFDYIFPYITMTELKKKGSVALNEVIDTLV